MAVNRLRQVLTSFNSGDEGQESRFDGRDNGVDIPQNGYKSFHLIDCERDDSAGYGGDDGEDCVVERDDDAGEGGFDLWCDGCGDI